MPDTALFVTLPDGRQLGYAEYGALEGAPVVFLHGGGGCRMVSASFAAAAWGLIEVPKEAMRQGAGAHAHEFSLYTRPLDFAVEDITVPVHLIHGADDRNVPPAIAEHVARQIPTAVLQVLPGAGHTLLAQRPQVLFDLVAPQPEPRLDAVPE